MRLENFIHDTGEIMERTESATNRQAPVRAEVAMGSVLAALLGEGEK